jgi:hypothetical protein
MVSNWNIVNHHHPYYYSSSDFNIVEKQGAKKQTDYKSPTQVQGIFLS